MSNIPIQQIVISHDKNMALLGCAIEAIFLTHPNKEELAKVFKEICDAKFQRMSRATDLDKRYFDGVCKARDGLIQSITNQTAGS